MIKVISIKVHRNQFSIEELLKIIEESKMRLGDYDLIFVKSSKLDRYFIDYMSSQLSR